MCYNVVFLPYQTTTTMETINTISIEKLAEKLNGKLWIKGDMKRIYLDEGYNTKKMTTKTYVYQREDGTFGVSCYIDCPSQPMAWIKSQQEEVIEYVENRIDNILSGEDEEEIIDESNYTPRSEISELKKEYVHSKPTVVQINFKDGDRCKHNTFGEGTVRGLDEKMILIQFDTVGEKNLLRRFANITAL